MPLLKSVNISGDLFATGFSFSIQALVKVASSMILTRIVAPETYGIISILMSILFVIEMLSDIGVWISLVRHHRGDDPTYLNTAWTLKLGRAILNASAIFLLAPIIAKLYHAPVLTAPLRVLSLWFLINGLESMSFAIAVRRKNSRIIMYSELFAAIISAAFSVTYCYFHRDYWGMLYGTLVGRAVYIFMSYQFYREIRPKLTIDRKAARELFEYTRFAMPSAFLTLIINQFDKVIFLRFFSLQLLGAYGIASNIAAPIESLITKISQMVLYPRCTHNFRNDAATFTIKYYRENPKLFAGILFFPAAVGGAAKLILALLCDPRYAIAGVMLQILMIRSLLMAFASPAEDLLIATGESRIILVSNIYKGLWIFVGTLLGYYLWGFKGFLFGVALSGLPSVAYYFLLQWRKGYIIFRYELYKAAFACAVAVFAYAFSALVLDIFPISRIRL